MPSGYVIDAAGIEKLREDHETLRKRLNQLEQKLTGAVGAGVRRDREFAKVTTQIGQRVTTTLGSGKADIYKIDKSDGTFAKIDDSEIDVYNSSFVPVPVDSYVRISRNFRSGLWMIDELQTAVAKADGSGVTARSGTTAGSGTVAVYYIAAGVLTDTGETLTAYNLSATAVANNAYITIKRCSLDEEWIVDAEDCG